MNAIPPDLIVAALLDPASTRQLEPLQWDLLIRQGRRTSLLARLAHALTEAGVIDQVPAAARHHLDSALLMVERHRIAVRWEIDCICHELADAGVPVVLLKGAAYVAAGLPVSQGRTFSDVDIIVPKASLGRVESELMLHGWQGTHHDAYDQQYYRRWMHEIPPMRHISRGTAIDVHHSILPDTARVKVDTRALLAGTVPVAGNDRLHTLAPVDMLLHSATHLFHEGEFDNGLRDLFDLDGLMRHFGATIPGFWERLVPRARELGLLRPLYYALRYTRMLLGTPVPEAVAVATEAGGPSAWLRPLMDACYTRALRPMHGSVDTRAAHWARFALYVRSHWIRMPWPLLAYHLGRKSFLQWLAKYQQDPDQPPKPGAQPAP